MPTAGGIEFLSSFTIAFGTKAFIVLFLIFYTMFALILYRQVQIMNSKLPTQLSPILRFVSVLNVGVSVAILFLIIGMF